MDGIGLKNLEQALSRYVEIGVETGVATAGTNTTLTDSTKSWEANRWLGGDIHIFRAGTEYVREITINTATVITFNALPGVVAPVAGDFYSIRRIVVPLDVVDRWARQLGQVDLARVLGGALAHANPLITRLTNGAVYIDPRDTSDRWARLVGQVDLARVLGAALAHANPVIARISDGAAFYNLATQAQLTPLQKALEHNTAELAATDILGAALTPTNTPCLFRVMVSFDTAGVFSAIITNAGGGGGAMQVNLNSGANLVANALYSFDHLVHLGDTVNYQISVGAQLLVLRVQEIVAGVQ